jgi:O-antigen/teichoic acid export membrane protein
LAISLPASISQKVQLGFQEGFQANLWQAFGSMLMLLGILLAVYQEAKLPWLVFAAVGGPTLALILNWVHQFCFSRKWLFPRIKEFKWNIAMRILSLGTIFTWFQVVAFVGTTLDNVIISHYYGPEALAKYALMYKLLTGLLIAQLFSAGLWPAIGEALERGDIEWVRSAFNKMLRIFTILGLITALIMGVGSHWIIKYWVGEEMIPSFWMAFGFACWSFITNFFGAIASTLSNNASIRKLTLLTTFAAFSALVIKIIFAHYFTVDSIIWGTVLGYGMICLPGFFIVQNKIKAR